MFRKLQAGFTLIESLVVITIIGVLAVLIFPVFGRVRESARVSQCGSNLRQVGLALELFAQEHRNVYPEKANTTSQSTNGCDYASQLVMAGYINKRSGLFSCPSDPGVLQKLVPADQEPLSYRYLSPSMDPGYGNGLYGRRRNKMSIATPGNTVMLTEYHSRSDGTIFSVQYKSDNTVYPVGGANFDTKAKVQTSSGHRNGGLQFLFFDGHIAFMPFGMYPVYNKGDNGISDTFWGDAYARTN